MGRLNMFKAVKYKSSAKGSRADNASSIKDERKNISEAKFVPEDFEIKGETAYVKSLIAKINAFHGSEATAIRTETKRLIGLKTQREHDKRRRNRVKGL